MNITVLIYCYNIKKNISLYIISVMKIQLSVAILNDQQN